MDTHSKHLPADERRAATVRVMFMSHVEFAAQRPGTGMIFGEPQRARSTPAKRLTQTLIQCCGERLHPLIDAPQASAIDRHGIGSPQ